MFAISALGLIIIKFMFVMSAIGWYAERQEKIRGNKKDH